MLRGVDMQELCELRREGLSVSAISSLTGYDRKTVRKYLLEEAVPRYGPRSQRPSILEPFHPYIEERLRVGVWNAAVLLRELKERGYPGGYTVLKDYLRPKRRAAESVAVRRFETPAGHQAQVDWGDLGTQEWPDGEKETLPLRSGFSLSGFVLTLGHSRVLFADVTTDQTLGTLLRLHEAAFEALGGIPKEILYDRMKTVVLGTDERGEILWHPVFRDFARYWGFTPRLCRPYRPQTKGKVESGIRYLKGNFLCGRMASDLDDLRGQLRSWTWEVANRRLHGTTHRVVFDAWTEEKACLQPMAGHPPFPYCPEALRRVSRDAYVSYRGNRYSVPWRSVGQEVCVLEREGRLEVFRDEEKIAVHTLGSGKHQVFTVPAHHAGIPTDGACLRNRPKIQIRVSVPEVEVRPLWVYETFVAEGGLG